MWSEATPRLSAIVTSHGRVWVAWTWFGQHAGTKSTPALGGVQDGHLGLLSQAERERALALTGRHRDEFVLARALARSLAGAALLCPPPAVPIVLHPSGKPCIADDTRAHPLWFSLTHAQGLVAAALSSTGTVGLDAEFALRRPRTDLGALAKRVLGPGDRAALAACPAVRRMELFLRLWVRREAVVKAAGTGLATTFGTFDVCDPGEPITIAGSSVRFEIRDITLAPQYLAALACAR